MRMPLFCYQNIIHLIQDLNAFIDRMDSRIQSAKNAYASQREAFAAKQEEQLRQFETRCGQEKESVTRQAAQMLEEAVAIQNEVARLDKKLEAADKYYQKTKQKRQQELAGVQSSRFVSDGDYFLALKEIKENFSLLEKKYSEDILPQLLNGINYLFSAQRKKDYEELLVLQNTVNAFVREMNAEIPKLAASTTEKMQAGYDVQREELLASQQKAMEHFDESFQSAMDGIAAEIDEGLSQILPNETIAEMVSLINRYRNAYGKINKNKKMEDGVLYLGYVLYRVEDFVESDVLAAFINERCRRILSGKDIVFPVAQLIYAPCAICVKKDEHSASRAGRLMQGIQYAFLSTVPVGRLKLCVVDCAGNGNGILVFGDFPQKLPELFDGGICTNGKETAEMLGRLNEKIECQAKDHPEEVDEYTLVTIYDFPAGMNERMLFLLENIIANGAKCGIYVAMTITKKLEEARLGPGMMQAVNRIAGMCMTVDADAPGGRMSLHGLWYAEACSLPVQSKVNRFLSNYALFYESIRRKNAALPEVISRILRAKDKREAEADIVAVSKLAEDAGRNYALVPGEKCEFPYQLVMGQIHYPADIFTDNVIYDVLYRNFSDGQGHIALPMLFDLTQNSNLMITYTENDSAYAKQLAEHFLWCFLSEIPVNRLNICVCDYEKKGRSLLPLMKLRNECPQLFDGAIHTNAEDIYERLQKLDLQIDNVIQSKLAGRFPNMAEYNRNMPNRPEPVTVLVIFDFPGGFEQRSRQLLMNIMKNGGKCGIYTILCHNRNTVSYSYENTEEWMEGIREHCTVLLQDGEKQLLYPHNLFVSVQEGVDAERAERFASLYKEKSKALQNKGLAFQEILGDTLFDGEGGRGLSIPVGVGDGNSIVSVSFGKGSSHHALIAGATGSGKSTLLHTLIMSAMLHYSPDNLHLYLMDFKSGTEFKIYESARLPHIKLLALDAMQEFGESILENLVEEMARRSGKFKEYNVSKISEYVKTSGKNMPAILVVMDEFQVLYNDASNRKVALNCAQLTKRIVTEGRSFGIHLVMATQSTNIITDLTLESGTIEQMRIRIGLKCGEADARYLFADRNEDSALDMMKGPIGTAVMNEEYTEQDNIGFRTAFCDEKQQKHYLSVIEKQFSGCVYDMQTFEGGRTVDLTTVETAQGAGLYEAGTVSIEIGGMIKVAPPLCVTFDRKRRHNTLICGADEKMTNNLVRLYCLGILQNTNTNLYCLDGEELLGEEDACYEEFARFGSRFLLAKTRGDVIRYIRQVYDEYTDKKKHGGGLQSFIVIKNLQFLDLIKAMFKNDYFDENEYLEEENVVTKQDDADPLGEFDFAGMGESMGITEKMQKLIDDGTAYGIHFIVTSTEYQSVRETMYYGSEILSKFPERFVYALGDSDADSLIDGVAVSTLGSNTVYYTDSVKNTFQVKPYLFPQGEDLRAYVGKILEG